MTREYVEKRMRQANWAPALLAADAVTFKSAVDVALALVQEAQRGIATELKQSAARISADEAETPVFSADCVADMLNDEASAIRFAAARKPEREGGGE